MTLPMNFVDRVFREQVQDGDYSDSEYTWTAFYSCRMPYKPNGLEWMYRITGCHICPQQHKAVVFLT